MKRSSFFITVIALGICWSSANLAQTTPSTPVPNGTLPNVSPDGRRIAFVSKRNGIDDLFIISASGRDEVQLTRTPESESFAGWNRNGRQVFFSVFNKDTSRLFAIDRDGKNQRELGSVPGRGPKLSPDGKRLVYMAGTWTATLLMTSALDGSDAKQITDGSSIAWNVHWSPDGKRVAFTGRKEPKSELAVFVMDADGSGLRQVTNIPAEEGGAQWPVWSPNGRRLAIQVNNRTQKNSSHIWIVDVASSNARKLASHDQPYLDETPSWFPDGKRIALQSNRTGRMEVWVMNVDGAQPRQLTGTMNEIERGQEPRTPSNNMFPQWSHDGKKITFTSDRDGDPEIYVMNADGSNPVRLTHAPGRDAHPYFSRDGRMIVFQSPRANRTDTNIYVMKSDGSNPVRRTDLKGFAGVPVYSPDEKSIVFQWRESNNFDDEKKWRICMIDVDGSNFRVITPGKANDQVPNWSRNGERLLFYSDRMGKNQIYTMKPDGSDVQRLATTEFNDQAGFWSRDNRNIVFTSDRDGNSEIYVMEASGKRVRRLTRSRATERGGVWSPDGKKIVFSSDGDGPAQVYTMNADGSGVICLTDASK